MFKLDDQVLIVHDGKLAGGLGATVLARLLRRREDATGADVEVRPLPPNSTSETFWDMEVDRLVALPDIGNRTVVLFGITFFDLDAEKSLERLGRLRHACKRMEIWSHRWPDGFSSFVDQERQASDGAPMVSEVRIPPEDIVTDRSLGILLSSDEKKLLRLTLYSVATIARNSRSDDLLIAALNQWIAAEGGSAWRDLENSQDLATTIQRVAERFTREQNLATKAVVEDRMRDVNFIEVRVEGEGAPHRKIEILDAIYDEYGLSDQSVVLSWLNSDRVMLYRRDRRHEYPSLRWLVENRFSQELPDVLRGSIYGPQNSVYFKLGRDVDRSEIRSALRKVAIDCASSERGGRYLQAALARDVAAMANDVFVSIDLLGKYTKPSDPQIRVNASTLYELIHESSRTGAVRRTLVMPVDVTSADATAFLFRDQGYNFQKAERLLEGALIGLKRRNMGWLNEGAVPDRLRIDVRPASSNMDFETGQGIVTSLQGQPMESINAEGLVNDQSLIGRFLARLGMSKLVSYAESETIGPSVAHALALDATAAAVAASESPGTRVSVLDLFAGSGVAHRLLSSQHDVVSVDLYVSASSVDLETQGNGIWLKADARRVLDREDPLIERHFDVIGLDPPHSELLELLFGASEHEETLVELMAYRTNVMVMYQGHTTQRGRLHLIHQGLLRSGWSKFRTLQVEEELIVIAAKGEYGDQKAFDSLVSSIQTRISTYATQNGLGDLAIRAVHVAE